MISNLVTIKLCTAKKRIRREFIVFLGIYISYFHVTMKQIIYQNPRLFAKLTISYDNHFIELFITYACFLQGFSMVCLPIISIDSTYLSGPYKSVSIIGQFDIC